MDPGAEASLIDRCCQGDLAGWDALFDCHHGPITRFAFQLAPDLSQEDAEEICQETFLSAIHHLPRFNRKSRLQTWLFRIAANKAYDLREKRTAVKRGGHYRIVPLDALTPDGQRTVDPASESLAPDDSVIRTERAALLREALESLGPPCREIIELRYFGELSYEEISTALELKVKTVSSRLSKCLDRLEEEARPLFRDDGGENFTASSV